MRKWIVAFFVLVVLGGLLAVVVPRVSPVQSPPTPTPTPEEETLTAKALVVPVRHARLGFKVGGRILEILPQEGNTVLAGQALIRLDPQDFDLQFRAAEDALAMSQALLAQMQASARPQDLTAAAAGLEAAQAAYDELMRGAREEDVAAARGVVRDAQVSLDNARLSREVIRNSTTVAQTVRDAENEASWYEDNYGRTLTRFRDGGASRETLDQDYANLVTAKEKLTAARQNAEIAATSADNGVTKAQDALEQARSRLQRLEAGPEEAQIKTAQARIQEARAQLERLRAGPLAQDLEVARVRVRQAETGLEQARAASEASLLTAPFQGRVASILGRVGEPAAPGSPVLVLADLDQLQVETRDLDEATAARLSLGQKVSVSVNAFKDKTLPGRITQISPMASFTPTGDPVYTVTIALDHQDPELRWGMSAKVEFQVR